MLLTLQKGTSHPQKRAYKRLKIPAVKEMHLSQMIVNTAVQFVSRLEDSCSGTGGLCKVTLVLTVAGSLVRGTILCQFRGGVVVRLYAASLHGVTGPSRGLHELHIHLHRRPGCRASLRQHHVGDSQPQ